MKDNAGQVRLLILLEVILLAKVQLGLCVLVGKICHPTRTEVDMPAPKATKDALWILIVLCPESASFTREFLFSHI